MSSRIDPYILALDVGYGNVKGFGASSGNPQLEQVVRSNHGRVWEGFRGSKNRKVIEA